jgi:hypothetical protein
VVTQFGWSPAVYDLIAAQAEAFAAAKSGLDAAASLREATEKLLAELEGLQGSSGS